MINMLINQDITVEQALKESLKLLETHEQLFYERPKGFFGQTPMAEFMNMIDRAVWLSKEPLSDIDCIRQIGEGWTAEEAFAIAIYSCVKYPNSFEDAIGCAVNHDGDSDSTGAIAGNIMGAALGMQNIPQYYVDNVELKDVVFEIADDLHQVVTNVSVMKLESWYKKYIDCKIPN
jgi:hypothetical protein